MKLGLVTKLGKRNSATSKNDDDAILANYDVIVIIPINAQFGAIRELDPGLKE